MPSQEQIRFAQNWLQGAFKGYIKDELRFMIEENESVFFDVLEEDLFLDISVRVSGSHL